MNEFTVAMHLLLFIANVWTVRRWQLERMQVKRIIAHSIDRVRQRRGRR